MFKKKKVKYLLTAIGHEFTLRVTLRNGKIGYRKIDLGNIEKIFDIYCLVESPIETLINRCMKTNIAINLEGNFANVNNPDIIEIIKKKKIEIKREVEKEYLFFKPEIKYIHSVDCKEI